MLVSPATARLWRIVLALMLAADAVILAVWTHQRAAGSAPGVASSPMAPWSEAVAHSPLTLATLAAIVCLCSFAFARRPGRALSVLAAVACTRPLIDAFGFVFHDHIRSFFYSGALLTAWGLAVLFTRAVLRGRRPGPALDQVLDTTGAAAAAAVLGAIYLNAGLSKLIFGGADWVNPAVIRLTSVLVSPAGGDAWDASLRALVVSTPWLAHALALATVALELQGVFFGFGRRARLICGTGLLAFHVGTFVMSDIVFVQAVILLSVFTFPWTDWVQRARPSLQSPGAPLPLSPQSARRARSLAAVLIGCVGMAWLVPAAAPAAVGTGSSLLADALPLPKFGPVRPGLPLAGGLRVVGIFATETDVRFQCSGPAGEVVLAFAPALGAMTPTPFDVGTASLAWHAASVDTETALQSGEVLAAELRSAATSRGYRDMTGAWHDWRQTADAP